MEDNLSNRIYKARFPEREDFTISAELTDLEKQEYAKMITSGCRQNTKATIRRLLEVPLSLWSDHGIYNRVTFNRDNANYPVEYCTGQDWHVERKTLRDCLLGKFD